MSYKIKVPTRSVPVEQMPHLSRGERILFFLEQRRNALLTGVLILVLAGVGVGVVLWLEHRNADQALALEARATDLHQNQRPAAGQAEGGVSEQKLGQAIELYQRIIEEYPRTPSAPRAMYLLGDAYMDQGESDRAIRVYRDFVATYPDQDLLLGLAYQRLGYAYLKSDDREEAAKAFSAVVDIPEALNKDVALFELGKLEEAQSRPEAALERYEQLIARYPNSPLSSEARLHIRALSPEKPEATDKSESQQSEAQKAQRGARSEVSGARTEQGSGKSKDLDR